MHTQIFRTSAVGILLTAVLAQAAVAAGEPKNELPFTRPVASRTPQAATHVAQASSPLIQGEPKNELPFTRPVASRTPQAATHVARASSPLIQGEPKNELPFTRPVASRTPQAATHVARASSPLIQGEPKNEAPFTRPVAQPATIVVNASSGFSWTDAAIGLIGGLGLAIVAAGATGLVRGAHRGTLRTAL